MYLDEKLVEHILMIRKRKKGKFKLTESVAFWETVLINKTMRLIDVTCNDPNFNIDQLKQQLLICGMSCIREDKGFNNIAPFYCTKGNTTGQFFNAPVTVNYYSPNDSGCATPDFDCVLVRNTTLYTPVFPLVQRYALILAHIDITIISLLVLLRTQGSVFVAKDDDTEKSINDFLDNAISGDIASIIDECQLGISTLEMGKNLTPEMVRTTIECRENIITDFLNDIGVQSAKSKKGNMLTPEIDSAMPKLLLSLNEMVATWRADLKKCEKMFDIQFKVELSEEVAQQFDVEQKEEKK